MTRVNDVLRHCTLLRPACCAVSYASTSIYSRDRRSCGGRSNIRGLRVVRHRGGGRRDALYPLGDHASDGEIGHVEDFFIEDTDWSIRHLIVDTRNWWPGKMVLISPQSASEIDWTDRLVNIDVDRHSVKESPAYDSTTVDRALERHFYTYYAQVQPSDQL